MRIALMTYARRGGMLQLLLEIANALHEELEIIVVTAKWANTSKLNKRIPHYQLDTGRNAFGTLYKLLDIRNYLHLIRVLRKERIDIIHFTGLHEWNPALGLLLKLFYRKPIVYTIHDPIHNTGTPIHIKIQDLLFRRIAAYYVVLSGKSKRDLLHLGFSPARVRELPLGIVLDLTKWKNVEIQEENRFLFWGRIEKYKGVDLLLNSAPVVLDALPEWELIIAGSGDFSKYEKLVNHERIRVINKFLSEREIAELIQSSKIIVFPYREGYLSGIIKTSMTFPKGIVATDTGAVNEVVRDGETGLLVETNNPEALSAAMIRLARDDELRRKLARNFMELNDEDMSWHRIVKKYRSFYEDIYNSKTNQSP